MSLKKFITNILNVDTSQIEKVESFENSDEILIIKIKLINSNPLCPYCNKTVKIHAYNNRKLTHSIFYNRKCIINYSQRRYKCSNCEVTFSEKNPFINTKENVTYETKINVLEDLKSPNMTYTLVAKRANISVTKVQRIFDKHVNIPRKQLPEVLSIDEHYLPNLNQDSLYICVLMDFNTGKLIDVLPDRKKEHLIRYFTNIKNKTMDSKNSGINELNNVKYVSIDLWQPYKDIAQTYFPSAIICADSFHVLKHLNEGFRKIRIKCRRETEDSNMQYLLTKFRFILDHDVNLDNTGKYNKRFQRYLNYRQMTELLFERFPELETAYKLKEEYINFNQTSNLQKAPKHLDELILKFSSCGIEEYEEFFKLLINWRDEIINSFTIYNNKRINNSYIESRNRIIETLIFNANGFINFKRTRNRIIYCINKDEKYKI